MNFKRKLKRLWRRIIKRDRIDWSNFTVEETRYLDVWRTLQNIRLGVLIAILSILASLVMSVPLFSWLTSLNLAFSNLIPIIKNQPFLILILMAKPLIILFLLLLILGIAIKISKNILNKYERFNAYLYLCRDPVDVKILSSQNPIDLDFVNEWKKKDLLSKFFKDRWEEWHDTINIFEVALISTLSGLIGIGKYGLESEDKIKLFNACKRIFKNNLYFSELPFTPPYFWDFRWLPKGTKIKRKCNTHWREIIFENSVIKISIRVFVKEPWFGHSVSSKVRDLVTMILTPEEILYGFGKDVELLWRIFTFDVSYELNLKTKAFFCTSIERYLLWAGGIYSILEKTLSFERLLKDLQLEKIIIHDFLDSFLEERAKELKAGEFASEIAKDLEPSKREEFEKQKRELEQKVEILNKRKLIKFLFTNPDLTYILNQLEGIREEIKKLVKLHVAISKICHVCGFRNPFTAKYCMECGTELEENCENAKK